MNKFDVLCLLSPCFTPKTNWKIYNKLIDELLEEPIIEDAEEYIIIENDMEVYYGK